jgi:glycosyltransferase involved in cell wall biosynthesis
LTDPLITACMIVRNEAHNLPACFASAAGVVDEWIVLDTGSTDGTVNVARSLGATVLQDPWRDDFSYSRNLSLEPATGRWILILDGDDRLHDPAELRRFLASAPEEDAFQMLVRSSLPAREGDERFESLWQPRVFRRSAGVRYRYPVHAVPVLSELAVGQAPGWVEHTGYTTDDARRKKAERTLRILERLPVDDPHRLYQHLRALATLERHGEIPSIAEQLAGRVQAVPADARLLWSQALLKEGRPWAAADVLAAGLADHPHVPDLYFGLLVVAGVGYAGSALRAHRRGHFDGVALTMERVPQTLRSLVQMGVLEPTVLEHEVMRSGGPVVGRSEDPGPVEARA